MEDKKYKLYTVSLQDCFCDYGIIGLLVLEEFHKTVSIKEFLLSCRVIGRKVEDVILDSLKETYKKRKFERIAAWYWDLGNNLACKDVYRTNKFEESKESEKVTDRKSVV